MRCRNQSTKWPIVDHFCRSFDLRLKKEYIVPARGRPAPPRRCVHPAPPQSPHSSYYLAPPLSSSIFCETVVCGFVVHYAAKSMRHWADICTHYASPVPILLTVTDAHIMRTSATCKYHSVRRKRGWVYHVSNVGSVVKGISVLDEKLSSHSHIMNIFYSPEKLVAETLNNARWYAPIKYNSTIYQVF